MEEYQGQQPSYEAAKLKVIAAVLDAIGIDIIDEFGIITILRDGHNVATIDISTSTTTPSPTP